MDRDFFHLLVYFQMASITSSGPAESGARSSILFSLRDPSTEAGTCCLPRRVSRKQAWEESSLNLGASHCDAGGITLHNNAGPYKFILAHLNLFIEDLCVCLEKSVVVYAN